MSRTKKNVLINNTLEDLLKKYKPSDVVSKIENNLTTYRNVEISISKIYLSNMINKAYYNLDDLYADEVDIRNHGIVEPLLIYRDKSKYADKYLLLNGTKRYLLLKKMPMDQVKVAIIENVTQRQVDEFILRNTIRNEDNSLIIAYALKQFSSKYKIKNAGLSQITGISYSQILNLMRILNLSEPVIKSLINNQITYTKARPLLSLKPEQQISLLKEIIEENLSVRDIEFKVNTLLNTKKNNMKIAMEGTKITINCHNPKQAKRVYKKIQKLYKINW